MRELYEGQAHATVGLARPSPAGSQGDTFVAEGDLFSRLTPSATGGGLTAASAVGST